ALSQSLIDEWMLGRVIASALQDYGLSEQDANLAALRVTRLTGQQHWYETYESGETRALVESMLQDGVIRQFLQVNRAQGVLWFNKEAFERLLWWMLFTAVLTITADPERSPVEVTRGIG